MFNEHCLHAWVLISLPYKLYKRYILIIHSLSQMHPSLTHSAINCIRRTFYVCNVKQNNHFKILYNEHNRKN